MLVVGRKQFAGHFRWFVAAVVLTAVSVGWYSWEFADRRVAPRRRQPGRAGPRDRGALIIAFEMLLWPRKRFPRVRTLPWVRTQWWMRAHIWLGAVVRPVASCTPGSGWAGG